MLKFAPFASLIDLNTKLDKESYQGLIRSIDNSKTDQNKEVKGVYRIFIRGISIICRMLINPSLS